MPFFRLKHSFTAGELSPLMNDRIDFDRYRNGCKVLKNMFCATQGPAVRRPGFEFIYDLGRIGQDPDKTNTRIIPFVFSETQSYVMIFYYHVNGAVRMVLGATDSKGTSGLVTYGSVPITECPPGTPVTPTPGDILYLDMPDGFILEEFDWAQSGDEMYLAQSEVQPHIIQRYDHECWVLAEVTFTEQPVDWSDQNGWPERVTFHQQRLVFAANKIRRQTVWMSQAGDYSSFGVSTPVVDSDAVTFTIASGKQNRIQWITSSKSLHIGTLGDEWTVSGNDQSALTPDNILAQRQTNSGSEANKPLMIGITTMFIEQHGRVINEFVYDYTYDSYKTSDMAILSPHLTEFYKITDWTYQQTPDSIIWSVREDGALLGITYQRQHKVVGWHVHDTQGRFQSISAIPGQTREDDVWVVVNRTIDGEEKYYIEKLADWYKSDIPDDGRFLDSYLVYMGAPATTVSGLVHLAGMEINALVDGTVHPPIFVDSLGRAILQYPGSHIVLGLPYESEVRPHLADADIRDGSSRGRNQRITNVKIDLYRSLGMYVGRWDREDGEHEEEIPFRVPGDLMGQAVPLFTGWYNLAFPEGFDLEAEYFIRQKQPLPLTVRGVVDEIEVYE